MSDTPITERPALIPPTGADWAPTPMGAQYLRTVQETAYDLNNTGTVSPQQLARERYALAYYIGEKR